MPLDDLSRILGAARQRTTLFGAPEGNDAAVLGALLRDGKAGAWLHVCRDDGRGFDRETAKSASASGLGLKGIDERVKILKGVYEINSEIGKGTALSVKIPKNIS